MTVKAEFTISARDKTAEAINSAKKRLDGLGRFATTLKAAFGGYIFGEFLHSVAETEIKLQSMKYTLAAATGSMAGAGQQMAFLAATADKLGISISDVGQYYARMATVATQSGIPLKKFQDEFVAISSAMRVLHIDTRHQQYAWLALQEIMSQGTVQTRHLTRQLSIDFPTALQAAAKGMGITTGQMLDMARQGKLLSSQFLPALQRGLTEMYGSQVQAATSGLQASLTRLQNAFTEMVSAAENTGAFDAFDSALNQLAATLKDPAFQKAFGEFLAGLAKLSTMTVHGFETAVGYVREYADIINGLHHGAAPGIGQLTGPTLGEQLTQVRQQIHQIQAYQQSASGEAHKWLRIVGTAGYGLFAPDATTTRLKNLKQVETNLEREITAGKGPQFSGAMKAAMPAAFKPHPIPPKIQIAHPAAPPASGGAPAAKASAPKVSPFGVGQAAMTLAIKAWQQATAAVEKHQQALKEDAAQWQDLLDPAAKYRAELKKIDEEVKGGFLSQKFGEQAREQTQTKLGAAIEQTNIQATFGKWTNLAQNAAGQMANAFDQFFKDPVQDGFRGLLSSFADMLKEMAAKWLAAQTMMAIGRAIGGSSSGWGSLFMQAGQSMMGSGKAAGGDVRAGMIYPVGERGPELFVPRQNGTIIPNHKLGNQTIVNIDATGAGPDEVSKLALIAHALRTQMRSDMLHYNAYGNFPAI